MDVDGEANAHGNIIVISRHQFTISDALAVYFLRKDERFVGARCVEAHDVIPELIIAAVTNGELRLSKGVQDRPVGIYDKPFKDRYLKLNGGYLKLSSAGSAFAFCLAVPLEARIREKFPLRTDKQIRGDVRHIYEAVVEVVDTENCRSLMPFSRHELCYPNAQKVDLLERVKEIADFLKQQIAQRGLTNDGFVAVVEETVRSIGLEYENVLDWFLDEGLLTENNFWVALNHRSSLHNSKLIMILLDTTIKNSSWTYSVLEARIANLRDFAEDVLTAPIIIHFTETYNLKVVCLRGTVVRATGRRFLFPTEWSKNGTELSQQLGIPGLASVAHSRDFAVASTLIAAYRLAVKALQHAVPNENFEPTENQRQKVQQFWTKFLHFVVNADREDVNRKLEAIQAQHINYMARPRPAFLR